MLANALTILTAALLSVTTVHAQITPPPCSPCTNAIAAVPSCATGCILSAAVTNAGCPDGNYSCQCASSAAIQDAALNCVVSDCGLDTGSSVLGAVSSVCSCVSTSGCTKTVTV